MKELNTLEEYETAIKGSKVVAIDFTATWCGPCKMIGPKFEAFSKMYDSIDCYKLDVDENADASAKAEISAMPTFKFYKDGKQIDELVGASEEKLKAIFEKYK